MRARKERYGLRQDTEHTKDAPRSSSPCSRARKARPVSLAEESRHLRCCECARQRRRYREGERTPARDRREGNAVGVRDEFVRRTHSRPGAANTRWQGAVRGYGSCLGAVPPTAHCTPPAHVEYAEAWWEKRRARWVMLRSTAHCGRWCVWC
jgi:hypothetical protein